MARPGFVSVVEAAYDLDAGDEPWLAEVAKRVLPLFDRGRGLIAYPYDFSNEREPIGKVITRGVTEDWVAPARAAHLAMPPELRSRLYQSGPCVTTGDLFGARPERFVTAQPMRDTFGLVDFACVVASNLDSTGCMIMAPDSTRIRLDARTRARWARAGAHLAAALRLRTALGSRVRHLLERADAVLEPNGAVVHAEAAARSSEARTALREAVGSIAAARGPLRDDADAALVAWTGLVAGRWSVVDRFDTDGRRFVVAVRNAPSARSRRSLSELERRVVGFLRLGHSYKVIAYELGVSTATVARAVTSACKKLGLDSRLDLARMPVRSMKRGEPRLAVKK